MDNNIYRGISNSIAVAVQNYIQKNGPLNEVEAAEVRELLEEAKKLEGIS